MFRVTAHKRAAVDHVGEVIRQHPEIDGWVLAGHSLGAALACRAMRAHPERVGALVFVGTTHPKSESLAGLRIPVTKVSGTNERVAPPGRVAANRGLLPEHTRWVAIAGANHSQFGHYGHQLGDGRATIRRSEQQRITRSALLDALRGVEARAVPAMKYPP